MKQIFKILVIMIFAVLIVGCKDKDNDDNNNNNNNVTIKNYLVTFINEKGETLDSKEWQENQTPNFIYNVNDTSEWDYTFEGWSSQQNGQIIEHLPAVKENATYYAVVSKVKKQYTISFDTDQGTVIESITADYGTLINEPQNPSKEGYRFMGWSYSDDEIEEVRWPITLTSNIKIYAKWNEKVNIKSYLQQLMEVSNIDPYSYIPETLRGDYEENHISSSDITFDLTNDTNVNNIVYGGFGQQWQMVLSNIDQSQIFFNVLSVAETIINSSVMLFNNYLDNNIQNTASHQLDNSDYTASILFENNQLVYTIQLKTSVQIPLIGDVNPLISMDLDTETNERSVRIEFNDNNVIKYVINESSYNFVIKYGIDDLSRKAYFYVEREDENVCGNIYEFITTKEKDVISSGADFYIDDEYLSVVGNKAEQIIAFKGYINELYLVDTGKLLGFEVRETLTFAQITQQYNTLWFNLNEFKGINTIKAIPSDDLINLTGTKNPYNIYLNGNSKIFKPKHNTVLLVETSRKYDIELKTQTFYDYSEGKLVEHQVKVPMLFVQEEDLESLLDYLQSVNNLSVEFKLPQKYIQKIQDDYDTLIDIFIEHKDQITSQTIDSLIG